MLALYRFRSPLTREQFHAIKPSAPIRWLLTKSDCLRWLVWCRFYGERVPWCVQFVAFPWEWLPMSPEEEAYAAEVIREHMAKSAGAP